jgi:hypothetical protein
VVIGPSTRRLIGELFDYADLGAVEIKGLAAPIVASRVLRESGIESRFAALRGARTPSRRPRRGAVDARAALAMGEERRGLCRARIGGAGHRQIASCRRAVAVDPRRSAHPAALFLLAAPSG